MAETIASMQARLRAMTTDWQNDNSHPCNYVRLDGMGTEVCRVDRWCGGFQNSHEPVTIGWRAQLGNQLMEGVVLVNYSDPADATSTKQQDIAAAIMKAKILATKAFTELQEGR